MHKSRKNSWDTRTLVFMGLLVAMHIVLTRLLVIELGSYRITVGVVCTILSGLWFGPVAGGLCGMVADLLGCLLKGYAVNPFITVAAMCWGIVPALFRPLMNGTKRKKVVFICIGVFLASVCSTLGLTTTGLAVYNGGEFAVSFMALLPGRLIQWAIMMPIYCVLSSLLYISPMTVFVLNASGAKPIDHTVKV
ncbi:MAG: folate family ECF transporter S component [Lachnospiraceae bacterium]|nr:folate family ECF transporter S component [Lachnospiraceae bacterium]